jgi:hypothetical protein
LTPGAISIAVDRLVARGLVSRVESAEDRRVKIVALTPRGKDLIVQAFPRHAGQVKRVFSDLSSEELRAREVELKKVGKRANALMVHGWFDNSRFRVLSSRNLVCPGCSNSPIYNPSGDITHLNRGWIFAHNCCRRK